MDSDIGNHAHEKLMNWDKDEHDEHILIASFCAMPYINDGRYIFGDELWSKRVWGLGAVILQISIKHIRQTAHLTFSLTKFWPSKLYKT